MPSRIPKVTIGLPVFNGARYLAGSLDSLVSQDYENFELIVSDNASTDDTGVICSEYAARDRRIRYVRNDRNIGLGPNHNRVFELSRGQFFKWAAYDDEYPPQMLSRCVEALDEAPSSVSLVYSPCDLIDECGRFLHTTSDSVESRDPMPHRRLWQLLRYCSVYNFVYGLMRADMLRHTRLHGSFPMADQVLFAELAMLGELREIREPLLRLRFHPDRSFVKHRTLDALRELFDPVEAKKKSLLTLHGRVQLELLRSACRMPTRATDRLLCIGTVMTVPYWCRFKAFGGRWKRKLIGHADCNPAS
jgi:glycosyltransferase involved in cell wall biosynthesis